MFFASIYYPVDQVSEQRTPDESKWSLLYHYDVSESVKFDTQLNGGFFQAEFQVDFTVEMDLVLQKSLLGLSVVIFDQYGNRVFEGTVDRTSIQGEKLFIYCNGHYQKAKYKFFDMVYSVLPATKNLCTCPSFEVASLETATGWSAFTYVKGEYTPTWQYARLLTELTYTFDPPLYGDKYIRIWAPGNETKYDFTVFHSTTNVVPNVTAYTFSFYIRMMGLTSAPYVQIAQNGTSDILAQATINGMVKGEWVRFQITADVNAPTSLQLYISMPNQGYIKNYSGIVSGYQIDIDGVQIEPKSYVTPYCDGMMPNCHWDGTAHVSTSYRDQEYVYLWEMLKDASDAMSQEWNPLFTDYVNADFLVTDRDFTNIKVADAIEGLLKGGYSETEVTPAFFAVYNNSIPHVIKPPNDNDYTWYIPAESLTELANDTEYGIDGVFNRVWAIYSDISGEPSKTAEAAEDLVSQRLFGVREGLLQAQESGALYDFALQLRDISLERNKDPKQTRTVEISGPVYDRNGSAYPNYVVRAGDSVLISNSTDYSVVWEMLYSDESHKTYKSFVTKTEYTAATGVLRLGFSDTDMYMESIFARIGADGGLE